MKIGIVCQNFPPASFEGGISHYSDLLANSLIVRGHEVWALTSSEFTRVPNKPRCLHGIEIIIIKGPWNHATVSKIEEIATDKRLDSVILQYSPASFKKSFRIMWAITPFSSQKITAFHTLWGKGLDRILGLFMLIGSKKIIATNSEIMTLLENHLSFLLKKTYWIPIGSNILPSNNQKQQKQFVSPLISYFGMLYPGKGLDLILDTLEKLRRRGNRFSFKFIGGGMLDFKLYEEDFHKKIESRNLADNVKHLGLIPPKEVSEWLTRSRFLFLPYERGLSDRRGSFMAAIVHGKAVLTSPPAVEMPFFRKGINVLWPDEPSLDGYVELVERLLSDDELISRLEQGAQELAGNFQWEEIAAEYELALHPKN